MTTNPYGPPKTTTVAEPRRGSTDRPTGVSILAALHFCGGLLLFGVQIIVFTNLGAAGDTLRSVGISPELLIVGMILLSGLLIASSVGMWMGTRWGWWLAAFYYAYSILGNIAALFTVVVTADQLDGSERGPEYYVIKHGTRVVITSLLLVYFFTGKVLEYFQLPNLHKGLALGILAATCTVIIGATVVVSALSAIE